VEGCGVRNALYGIACVGLVVLFLAWFMGLGIGPYLLFRYAVDTTSSQDWRWKLHGDENGKLIIFAALWLWVEVLGYALLTAGAGKDK
jgi:hypothetical protein